LPQIAQAASVSPRMGVRNLQLGAAECSIIRTRNQCSRVKVTRNGKTAFLRQIPGQDPGPARVSRWQT
jgi:hypothetical protein